MSDSQHCKLSKTPGCVFLTYEYYFSCSEIIFVFKAVMTLTLKWLSLTTELQNLFLTAQPYIQSLSRPPVYLTGLGSFTLICSSELESTTAKRALANTDHTCKEKKSKKKRLKFGFHSNSYWKQMRKLFFEW